MCAVSDMDCDPDIMNAVNPNLAMTNCLLDREHNDDIAEVCNDELNQTIDVKPDIDMWDENYIYESEPIVSPDVDETVQLCSANDQSDHLSGVGTSLPTAVVVTCTRKLVHQQPTIIVTRACHPTSYSTSPVVARVSKTGVLSKIKPATVTIDGSSGLVFRKNAVFIPSSENCLC